MDYKTLIGSISVEWNHAERHLDRLIHFYMNEDRELIDRLLAAVGNRSKGDILTYLVRKREPNPHMASLLTQLVAAFNIHRENRNTLQHAVPNNGGSPDRIVKLNSVGIVKEYEITIDQLKLTYDEMHEFCGIAVMFLVVLQSKRDGDNYNLHLLDAMTSLEKFPMPRKIDPLP